MLKCFRCDGSPCVCKDGITIYHGDCRDVLPTFAPGSFDLVLTDPPYMNDRSCIPQRGKGVSERVVESESIGTPWGYWLEWINACQRLSPQHSVIFANYKMLGDVCSALDPQSVFVWRKSNAARMARPVPRLDCEFIIWSRSLDSSCEDMGQFDSMVLDVPMPQAGCFATERILVNGSSAAAHPCQKPLAVVRPFVERLNAVNIIDPFMGSGTTLVAAKQLGRQAVGIELEERYCEIAARRLDQKVLQFPKDDAPKETQAEMFAGEEHA